MQLKWLMAAADQGHPQACRELADRYRDGNGVKKSKLLASMYERKAERKK